MLRTPYLISAVFLFSACASGKSSEGDRPPPPPTSKRKPRRPGSPPGQAELEAAVDAAKRQDLDGAIEHCRAAIAKNPQLEHAYLLYESSCGMKGDPDCEAAAFGQGLAALPRSINLKKAMALVHLGRSQYDQAIVMLEEANDLSKGQDAELLADLAYAHIFVKKLDAGEEIANKAIALKPKCFQCNMALGEILFAGKKFGKAAEAYGRAGAIVPDEPAPRRKRAKATYLSGNKTEAFGLYAGELEKSPDDAALRFEYAKVLLDGGKPNDAIAQIDKLLEANPDEPNLLKLLLKAQKKAKDRKGAKKTKKKLKKLGVKP